MSGAPEPSASAGAIALGRVFADVASLLESGDGSAARLRRALGLFSALVPYDECGLLEARLGYPPLVLTVPDAGAEERGRLEERLLSLFGELAGTGGAPQRLSGAKRADHLAVPLVGLDQLIGLLLVRSATVTYTQHHLRALAVLAATFAAYLTTLRGRNELAELARERDEARLAAEAASRAKDELLALVSHELKAPLSSIRAGAELLRSAADAGARSRALDALERDVATQGRLIDGLLDLASVSAASLRLQLQSVEPAAVVGTAVDGLRLEAARKAIRLDAQLDPAPMPLPLDARRIAQVVSILVANAIRLTPAGGAVVVRLEGGAGMVRISVADGGRALGPEAQARAFERFPVDPAARDLRVLGGGLAMVKELVELHGGTVRARSEPATAGATFTVELPRPADSTLAAPPVADPGLLAGLRVLLIDHDPSFREACEAVLAAHGAETIAVASAREALAALQRGPHVLLFGDFEPVGATVHELVQEVTARACPLPIASISAWRLEELEHAPDFRLHLRKPVEIRAFVGAVAELAGRAFPAGL